MIIAYRLEKTTGLEKSNEEMAGPLVFCARGANRGPERRLMTIIALNCL